MYTTAIAGRFGKRKNRRRLVRAPSSRHSAVTETQPPPDWHALLLPKGPECRAVVGSGKLTPLFFGSQRLGKALSASEHTHLHIVSSLEAKLAKAQAVAAAAGASQRVAENKRIEAVKQAGKLEAALKQIARKARKEMQDVLVKLTRAEGTIKAEGARAERDSLLAATALNAAEEATRLATKRASYVFVRFL